MKVRLGDYVSIKTGRLDANAASENGKFPFFTCSVEPLKIDKYSYDCECVLVAGNGDLNVKYYYGKFDAYQRTYIIESRNKNILSVKYLYFFLDNYLDTLRKEAIGGVIKYIKLSNLSEAKIKLLDLEKQLEIVNILENINLLISLRKNQLKKLDELVKSRFIEMFSDPVTNSKMWEIDCLGNITTKIGSGMTPRGGKESYLATGVALIRSMNVHDGKFEYKDLAYISAKQAFEMKNVELIENDVLFNITGASVTRTCVVPNTILPARVNQHVAIIRCINESLNPIFLNNLFLQDGFKYKLLNLARAGGAMREAITKQQLEDLNVILPPIEIQNQFADFVEQTDKSKFVIQKLLNYLL